MARIIVFGAGGRVGGAAVSEARVRRHDVTGLTRATGDVADAAVVAATAQGHDVAIVAVADATRDASEFFPSAARSVVAGLAAGGVPRLVWVSLSALLPDAHGTVVMNTPGFPQQYRPVGLAHREALDVLSRSELDWVAVSPSGDFDHDGQATGSYRIAPGDLAARISFADHARALIDEAERADARRAHIGVRV